jgi:DNA adenine methylase
MTALRPLLKWPGGKTRELRHLTPHLPDRIADYYEPFVGGAAMLLATPFTGRAYANDVNRRLIDFYDAVLSRDAAFRDRLEEHIDRWSELGPLAARTLEHLGTDRWTTLQEPGIVDEVVRREAGERFATLQPLIAARVRDKIRRVLRLQTKHDVVFTDEQWAEHIETAVRSAYYTAVRDLDPNPSAAGAAADFFFVREMCYGSMFRFNTAGKFNIPYGGIGYNRKNLRGKAEYLFSDRLRERLSRCTFACDDFASFLGRQSPRRGDFAFFDPPYDTDFSAYDNRSFTLDDHQRLADCLAALRCAWLLVIKGTEDVERIYGPLSALGHVVDASFAKDYTYNVRGRNERSVTHRVWVGSPA